MIANWSASVSTADPTQRFDVTAQLLNFTGIVRHLGVGEWEATIAAPSLDALLAIWPGTNDAPPLGFAIQVPGQVVISGEVNTVTYERSGTSDTMTLAGVDEYAALHTRIVYPQPADPPPWNTNPYHLFTGLASAAVADFVTRQIGQSARAERQLPGLVVYPNDAGPTGTWQFRADFLDEAVTKIATEAGLSVRVRRRLDVGLDVLIGAAVNRTDIVLDQTVLGDSTLVFSTAEATTPIAGGSGEGTSRLWAIAGGDVTGVARREMFSDQRNIDSLPALQRSVNATRSALSAATTFSGSLTDEAADLYLWRRDYDLGDIITLRIGASSWAIQISGVNITIDPATGMRLSPILGFKPKNALSRLLRDVSNLASRLNTLEVR